MLTVIRRVVAAGLLLVGLAMLATLVLPQLFGRSAYVVSSGSMSPAFEAGAVVVTAPVDFDEIAMRDIITFRGPDGYTTHRVVGIDVTTVGGVATTALKTKGDANEDADPTALDPRNVVGEAKFAVPHLGYLVAFVKTPIGAGLAVALLLFVMMVDGKRVKATGDRPDEATREPALT